ncbi:MAG: NADPH-dependent glutamate synthase [Eubacteriales bacterium]
MKNNSPVKTPMPHLDPVLRAQTFDEVATGYTPEMAMEEARRCLNCRHQPCVAGCPVNVHIPEFIAAVAAGEFEKAYQIILSTNSLPAVCGRVCPQESQCERVCVRGLKGEPVGIGRLERFVADYHLQHHRQPPKMPVPNGHRVAVIGSGPAGLACAGDLARAGYAVTVFEALHVAGGVLVYGIPEFRLPKDIVRAEVENLQQMGVVFAVNMVVGKVVSVDELLDEEGFDAVFIGTGAGLPRFMDIPGETLKGVYSANEFLTRVNLMKAYKKNASTPIFKGSRVAVVGGGNVAMDAARCAKRLGASHVQIIYRRSEAELPARAEEVEHAKEEGVAFSFLTNPTRIIPGEAGFVGGMECVEMTLGEPDASGRRSPHVREGSEYTIPLDVVIMAIGTSPNPLIKNTTAGLAVERWGGIVAEESSGATSRPGVFAGGDAVTGAATVIAAMGAGKRAAAAIDQYVTQKISLQSKA